MKNSHLLSLALLCFFHLSGKAQLFDDFSDGNLSHDPTWLGDTAHFVVNKDFQLQLNATEAGNSVLWLPFRPDETIEWQLFLRLGFAPSANNYVRTYLIANQQDLLADNTEAFYLQIGENGASDAIELYHQQGPSQQLLCRGSEGLVADAFLLRIKVIKEKDDRWAILVDKDLNGYYKTDSHTAFPFTLTGGFFALYCQYTSSNRNRFYFDDIYVGPLAQDTIPPQLMKVVPHEDLHTLSLYFDEAINPENEHIDINNFLIKGYNVNPMEYTFSGTTLSCIQLRFEEPFKELTPYTLSISGLRDLQGNIMTDTTVEIDFYRIKRNDVLIHEIMANPFPVVHLPNAEYIELFNCTNRVLELENWNIQTGKTLRALPLIKMCPRGYAVITAQANLHLFDNFENVYPVSALTITDAGQQLLLLNQAQQPIHYVNFNSNWHSENAKKNGGWALEMIDTENPCTGKENWSSSVSPEGGTPGKRNSVSRTNPDLILPEIERITMEDSVTLQLFFTETVYQNRKPYTALFHIDREVEIIKVEEVFPENRSLRIILSGILKRNVSYTLTIMDTLMDCCGNMVNPYSTIRFGIPEKALPFDLIINEIMINPLNGEKGQYIEIYNRSDKIIDLKEILLGSGGDSIPKKSGTAVSGGYQLFPKELLALCADKEITKKQYITPFPEKLISCDSIPSFPKSSGVIYVVDKSLRQIDRFAYHDKMHYEQLKSTEGVALERVNPDVETQNANNWVSAAQTSGFGTPGYKNSQHRSIEEQSDIITVQPEIFSPDGDGFDDFTLLVCKFAELENRVTITIFDRKGEIVKTIANNVYCGNEAQFLWDGSSNKGYAAPPELYIIQLEYWNSSGKSNRIRKVVGIR